MAADKSVLMDDKMRRLDAEYLAVSLYNSYARLATRIMQDKRLSGDFSSDCLKHDMRSMYARLVEVVFSDEIDIAHAFGRSKANNDIIRVVQVLGFEASGFIDGYEKAIRDRIKKRQLSKKRGEEMIKNYKERNAAEDEKRKAHSFLLQAIRIGEDAMRSVFELVGEDFQQAAANCVKHYPEESKKTRWIGYVAKKEVV